MKKICWLLLPALCLMQATYAQDVSLRGSEISYLKTLLASDTAVQRLYAPLKATAVAALEQSPAPIDTIHTEGRLQGDPQKVATQAALKDMNKMYALALQYRLTNEERYKDKAIAYLQAWATHNKANGDPIDDTNLDPAVEAYDLLKTEIPASQKASIDAWLQATAQEEIRRATAGHPLNNNNWHSHRIKEVGEIGFAIDNKTFQQYAIDGIREQVAKNLKPDGSSIDFESRDALHYQLYDLEPLLKLAVILQRATGKDYYRYTDNERSIAKSVAWTVPYITGEKTHAEYLHSTVEFDRKRAANKEAAFRIGAEFIPQNGLLMITLAQYFQPDLRSVRAHLQPDNNAFIEWINVLNILRTPRS